MEHEISVLSESFATYKKDVEKAFHYELPNPKNVEISEKVRKEGNTFFFKKSHSNKLHEIVLSFYNQSAALAPSGSQELASAYANRSAFLLHIGKYEECIQDIQKTLEITKSNELKVKLLCRKVECLKRLGTNCEDLLIEAQSLVDDTVEDGKNKQILKEMITKVAAMPVTKKNETDQEINEAVNLPITDNFLEKVSIRHSEKYGRHLVAEQNYSPGDIIFVENCFATSVTFDNRHTYCHHCLKICWSGIPCEHCNWVTFCSEECSQKAWNEYHDIECWLGFFLDSVLDITWDPCSLSIKILVKALKDAGSIENLKAQFGAVDDCIDLCSKGFYKDKKFISNTVESLYTLSNKENMVSEDTNNILQIVITLLVGLVKHPQLKNLPVEKFENLSPDNDVIYVGALLIKFIRIEFNNAFTVVHFASMYNACRYGVRAPRGSCIAPLASVINHSCCPNASKCFTGDGKIIIFAVQPVEKNAQIFISYCKEYYFSPLKERKLYLKDYNFECDCEACTKAWPALLFQILKSGKHDITDDTDTKFIKKCIDLKESIFKQDYSKESLEKLVTNIILAFKSLKQPSTFTCIMLDALNACITNIYNGLKPQMFGKCKKCK